MTTGSNRREFLRNATASGVSLAMLNLDTTRFQPVGAAETFLKPDMVRFSDEIEPTVRLLEETPRESLIEEAAHRVRAGKLGYQELLAGLMLAGIRNVQPRPYVGFKFHTVLVVNSAHLASQASSDRDRWLPIFWAIDYFKTAQQQDANEGDWTMPAVDDSKLPPSHTAKREFINAMESWDEEAADAAIASFSRVAPKDELFELMVRYGCRDFRDIGHKAIYVANSFRLLETIGWRFCGPVMRSLAYALLCRSDDGNPAAGDFAADRPGRRNEAVMAKTRSDWQFGRLDSSQAPRMIDGLFADDEFAAAETVGSFLNDKISPQTVVDSLSLAAAELLMRQPGIISLHAVTMTNAFGYAFRRAAQADLRLRLLLQNASFLSMFYQRMRRDQLSDQKIVALAADPKSDEQPAQAIAKIMQDISRNPSQAARQVLSLLSRDADQAGALIDAERAMIFHKGDNAHDYKFSSAVLEDYYNMSPAWRNHYLAAAVFKMRGAQEPDQPLVQRIGQAFA